ncbi:MAG: hypothetical protein QXY61_04355 [Candidatus Anstonellales archaeon]
MLIGLEVAAKSAVERANGRVPRMREIVKELDLVEEARLEVGKSLRRAGVDELIKEINKIPYPTMLNLSDVLAALSRVESEGKRLIAGDKAVLIGVLKGLAALEKCKRTYDSTLKQSLSTLIQNAIARIELGIYKRSPPSPSPKEDMGISYYAPW